MQRITPVIKGLIFILMAIASGNVYAQKDYVIMDGVRFDDIKLIDPGDWSNTNRCIVRVGDSAIVYTPNEVQEYGFANGRVYYASDVMVKEVMKKIFLRKMVNGNTDLYYYEDQNYKTFFIGPDSGLLKELPRRASDGASYHKQLQLFTSDCIGIDEAAQIVAYRKNYMTEFVERYNRCEISPFPAFHFGIVAGYGFTKLVPPDMPEYFGAFDYTFHGGVLLGLFVDQPVLLSKFSIHAELLYSRLGFSYYYRNANEDNDLIIQTSSVTLPLMCRYILPVKAIKTFVNAGGCFEYNFKNETGVYVASVAEPGVIEINRMNEGPVISDFQAGYNLGFGIEYALIKKHPLLIEVRYSRLYKFLQNEPSMGKSGIQLITGIKF
jgi:hypothetical protein